MNFPVKKGSLIVSCQAEGDDPFNKPELVLLFAKAAVMGGAEAIRTEGFEKTKIIKENITLPVIGLIKSYFEDGYVRITGSYEDVKKLIETGCDIIAVDGTMRLREGITGPEFIKEIKNRYECVVMADIDGYEEGIACAEAGADCISTTLSGYTPNTKDKPKDLPDFDLLKKLSENLTVPVIAEGKFNTPALAAEAIKSGAYAVVVGTAISRPRVITSWFADAIKSLE